LTLEMCVLLNMPLNFANIIALPLLLGVGVAFKIYYVMAWRRGRTGLVQSTLSRAVIFSAATTGTAFGSLWLSGHPGTSSMGELMGLALICTMMAAVLFQPALMGPPRTVEADVPRVRRLPEAFQDEPAPSAAAWHVERHDPPHLVIPPRLRTARERERESHRETEPRREHETVSDGYRH